MMADVLQGLINTGVTLAVLMTLFTALAFISRGPAAFHWTKGQRQSALTNIIISHVGGLNGVLYFLTIAPLVVAYDALGLPEIPAAAWNGWPLAAKALVALLVYDISLYWIHRVLHTSWLWPAHAVHHSDTDMSFLSWSRGHFTEQMVIAACLVFTSSWLGFGIGEIYMLALIQAVHQHYVHANIDWDHGPLRDVIVSPQFHRWHHANVEAAYDKNFATIFPFLDRMFGTYYNPGSAFAVPTGIPDGPGHNVVDLILYPLRQWARMLTA